MPDKTNESLRRELDDMRQFMTLLMAALVTQGTIDSAKFLVLRTQYANSLFDRERAKQLDWSFTELMDEAMEWLSGQGLPLEP